VAVVLAAAGWLTFNATAGSLPAGAVGDGTYQAGGFRLAVNQVERLGHHQMADDTPRNDSGTFQMPQSQMPGMQDEDEDRIHAEVVLTNPGEEARQYGPEQFQAVSPTGRWPLNEFTLQPAALPGGYSLSLELYFDVPTGEGDVAIEWSVDGSRVRIPLTEVEQPAHNH
jgi:hypothetical protein